MKANAKFWMIVLVLSLVVIVLVGLGGTYAEASRKPPGWYPTQTKIPLNGPLCPPRLPGYEQWTCWTYDPGCRCIRCVPCLPPG
jgi:hypothetical protein